MRVFTEVDRVRAALVQILRTAAFERFAVLAYCFMPDHVHLVVEGCADDADLRRFVKLSKQRVEYVLRKDVRLSGFWQDGFYDRILRADGATRVAIRYVLDNPVRARLVSRAEDYPFSGARFWPE